MYQCTIDDCSQPYSCRGLCAKHYGYYYRNKLTMPEASTFGRRRKHGMSKTTEYKIWLNIKRRCTNVDDKTYIRYGGRGIKVCDEWQGDLGFVNFIRSVGKRPSLKHSIERKDNDGNYEPSNCVWATAHQQAINKRNSGKTPGVRWEQSTGKWYTQVTVNNRRVAEARFNDLSAALEYRKAILKYHGVLKGYITIL